MSGRRDRERFDKLIDSLFSPPEQAALMDFSAEELAAYQTMFRTYSGLVQGGFAPYQACTVIATIIVQTGQL